MDIITANGKVNIIKWMKLYFIIKIILFIPLTKTNIKSKYVGVIIIIFNYWTGFDREGLERVSSETKPSIMKVNIFVTVLPLTMTKIILYFVFETGQELNLISYNTN